MAKDRTRGGKTETLTIRLDPKTRFILEFISRAKGQLLTTVIERAISEAADKVQIADFTRTDGSYHRGWRDFWSLSEGERALKMAPYPELFPSYEDEKRLAFCREHHVFFYQSGGGDLFATPYIDVLWPRIDEFIQIHESRKSVDYLAAGKAMQEALKAAGLKGPDWSAGNVESPF